MKKVLFLLFLTCLAQFLVFPQEILSFEDAIAIALKQNQQIEIARNNAAIAKNNFSIGNANLLPQVNLSSSASYGINQSISESSDNSTSTSAQLEASYTLFDGFGNIYYYKKLKSGSRLGELEARNLIELTLLNVGSAYYKAATAFENLQIAEELLTISLERLERAKKRSNYGRARTIDVLSAQVDFISDQVTLTEAKFIWDEARRSLNVFLNREIDRNFSVDTEVKFRQDFNLNALKAIAFSKNANYLASEERLIQSKYDLNIVRSDYLPRIDFSVSHGYTHLAPGFHIGLNNSEPTTRIVASLSLNLFNGLKTTIQNRNARISMKNRELTRQQARLDLEKDITSAFESYKKSLLVMDLEKKYVEAAELNFKRTQELYNLGQVTTTQFREAQLNLIRARNNLSSAKYNAKLNEIEILRLSGQLVK
jgi:outer membrane protein